MKKQHLEDTGPKLSHQLLHTSGATILCFWLVLSTGCCSAKGADELKPAQKTTNLQSFTFQGVSCSLVKPDKFSLTEKVTSVGKMFVLFDPSKEKKDYTSLSVSIVPTDTANENEMLDGVLEPYKQGLKNYKEEKLAPVSINGRKFQNRKFSGNFPSGCPTVGFVYITTQQGACIILIGDANGAGGVQALEALLQSVKSFR